MPLHEPTLRQEIDAYPVVLKIPYSDSSCGVVVVNSASELPDCIASTLGPASVWDPEKLPPEESAMSSNDEYGTSLRCFFPTTTRTLLGCGCGRFVNITFDVDVVAGT